MMSFRKLKLVLWKNYIVKRRHYIITGIEIILPTIWALFLLLAYLSTEWAGRKTMESHPRRFLQWFPLWTESDLHYTPNNNVTKTLVSGFIPYFSEVKGVKDENTIIDTSNKRYENQSKENIPSKKFVGLVFTNPFPAGDIPVKLSYRIRTEGSLSEPYDTEILKQMEPFKDNSNYENFFIQIQNEIALKYLELIMSRKYVFNTSTIFVAIQMLPLPAQKENESFWEVMKGMVFFLILVGFILAIPVITRKVLREKADGVKELMKIMGLDAWTQWTGWFITNYIIMCLSMIICVLILCLPTRNLAPMLFYSRPELILLTFLLIPASCIMFSFFVTTLFYRPTLALCCSMMIWFITYWIPEMFYGMNPDYTKTSIIILLFMCLFPIIVIKFIVTSFIMLEQRDDGLQWSNLIDVEVVGRLTFIILILMLGIQVILYTILTWYFDNIFPGVYGTPKPLYFPFTKKYWFTPKTDSTSKTSNRQIIAEDVGFFQNLKKKIGWKIGIFDSGESVTSERSYFEDEPTDLEKGIEIVNLTKNFGTFVKVVAVDNISFNVYEDQITALLGPNGAGKTTTMSIITALMDAVNLKTDFIIQVDSHDFFYNLLRRLRNTSDGMYYPSKGTVIVSGFDIRHNLADIRDRMGLCPQQNMLFESLTPQEHLEFYGKLKGVYGSELNSEVEDLMKKLKLIPSKNLNVSHLSGGMMRKLHLGIALVGGNTIVILDEPTSGLDTEIRREIWKILIEIKEGRTILLSTHYMDEADALGDRIAIMANGKVKCCGSPLFLKKKFGSGYHLNISKSERCDVDKVTRFIQDSVPNAYIERQMGSEVRYILPEDYSEEFHLLFTRLEKNQNSLGIISFGVSYTTMDEVFLNIGKLTEKSNTETEDINPSENDENKNTGLILRIQQCYGLLMKRFHYYRRRYILLIFQIICPSLMLGGFLIINNFLNSLKEFEVEPPLKLNLLPYEKTIVYLSANNSTLANHYKALLPQGTEIHQEEVFSDKTVNSQNCIEKCVISADFFTNGSAMIATALYNGYYVHSLPTSINYIHNALLSYYTDNRNWTIEVENAPLPVNPEQIEKLGQGELIFKYLLFSTAIFIGLILLTSSFIVLPIHERVSGNKHLQFLTGVGSVIYWGTTFLWDYFIYLIAVFFVMITLFIFDSDQLFLTESANAMLLLLMLLFGLSMIPLTYLFSFLFQTGAAGYTFIFLLAFFAVLGLYMLRRILLLIAGNFQMRDQMYDIVETFIIFPPYTVNSGLIKIALITEHNDKTCNYPEEFLKLNCPETLPYQSLFVCCPECKLAYSAEKCYHKRSYWDDQDDVLEEVIVLIIIAILVSLLLLFVDSAPLYKWRYLILGPSEPHLKTDLDHDVEEEKKRIHQLVEYGDFDDDVLVMYELTKKYGSFIAVDHLNVGIKKGECFGLLGVNGAGKTTTFNMMSGRQKITFGDIYLHGDSIKTSRGKYLRQISYCPQFDALIDHLNGREHLVLFSRLRGIYESHIASTVKNFISFVGIEDHYRKIVLYYSGGTKRKLSVGVALIGKPLIVFLDEPTSGVDPVSRHKIWNILNTVKLSGTSMILTSHNMEECENLCSRIGIMVNGQFQCLGGSQYLKGKFGEGFTIIAKLDPKFKDEDSYEKDLHNYIKSKFKKCILQESAHGIVLYHIGDENIQLARVFEIMEMAKSLFKLEDFSINQTSLEEIFISFAKKQRKVD